MVEVVPLVDSGASISDNLPTVKKRQVIFWMFKPRRFSQTVSAQKQTTTYFRLNWRVFFAGFTPVLRSLDWEGPGDGSGDRASSELTAVQA